MKTNMIDEINVGDMVRNKEFDMIGYVIRTHKPNNHNEAYVVVQWFHWPSPIPYGKYAINELVKMKVE